MHKRLPIASLILVIFLLGFPVCAQEVIELHYGSYARGILNHRIHRWTYVFDAQRGDRVTITVETIEGDLDPYVYLEDVNGNVLATDDDGGGGLGARLEASIRESARHVIVVTRYGGEQFASAGRFEIRLDGVPGGMFAPSPGYPALPNGVAQSGSIGAEQPEAWFMRLGWRGDGVNLSLSRQGGDFTPRLTIYPPGSVRPLFEWTAPEGRIAVEGVRLPLTGYYTFRVDADPPGAGGTFQILLNSTSTTPLERREDAVLNDLAPGEMAADALDETISERYYAFVGRGGQFVRAVMAVTGGDLAPLLILLDAETGDVVAYDDTPGAAVIGQALLPHDGRYILAAGRRGGAGAFTLAAHWLARDALVLPSGALSATLVWDGPVNLDLIARDPAGRLLAPDAHESPGGVAYVDMRAGCTDAPTAPVEHLYWPDAALSGLYEVTVWYKDGCGTADPVPFELIMKVDGEIIEHVRDSLAPDGQHRLLLAR